MKLARQHFAPNNFLHAASIVALADTTCGYATFAHLPEGAASFAASGRTLALFRCTQLILWPKPP